jgi:hypothetical protein
MWMPLYGQSSAALEIPASAETPAQTSRILGIMPNFRSVGASVTLPPLTAREKWKMGLQDSFDYSAFLFAGFQAGFSQATNAYPAFRQGGAAFGRYYWHVLADQTDENLWVEAILPTAFREDSRYYTMGGGGFLKRTGYAFSRLFVTRDDQGGETINLAEILGSGAAAGLSSAYYPGQYRTWNKARQRWTTNLALDGATLIFKEFWPDINRKVLHRRR